MSHFFSAGKILLTAEYVVLDGATAFAFPTKLGQSLEVKKIDSENCIHWKAYHQEKLWLECTINFNEKKIDSANDPSAAEFVLKLISYIKENSNTQLQTSESFEIITHLEFPSNFGLGSSSTLIANLAKWAQLDAFDMNEKCLGGSGYDIAVAMENQAISFQKKENQNIISPINWNAGFKKELLFVHLNKKQDSREGINAYRKQEKSKIFINEMNNLSKEIIQTDNLDEFTKLMNIHEKKISSFLQIPTAKEKYFSDCPSFIKSLGAWGGDFVLTSKFDGFENYFLNKNYPTFFSWNELIN